jgi:hypothetical protein
MPPVWVLSVDLQTKTATFETGMAGAAKSAKGSFTEIKEGAREMGAETSYSMGEARHGVMLLGEEFGVHIPRALTSFISSIGPIGAAMEAAFPFLAIAVGATLIIEHLVKMREEAEKAANAQTAFGTTVDKSMTSLDDKLLRAGIQIDDLNDNHMAALQKQLELIDHASLAELMGTFDTFAKAADAAFATLKTSWYQFSAGSEGARHALEDFKLKYDSLLAQGKDTEASDLLAGTLQSAQHILTLQEQARNNQAHSGGDGQKGNYAKFEEAKLALKKMGLGYDEKATESQRTLVDVLNDQVTAQGKIAALKEKQDTAATAKTGNTMGAEDDKKWRELGKEAKQSADDAQRAWDEAYKSAVSKLEKSEKHKIEATRRGSEERLAAINAAIKEEQSKGLQETGFYESLLTERNNLTQQMGDEDKRIRAELGKEAAQAESKMGLLGIAVQQEQEQLRESMTRVSAANRLASALHIADEEYAIERKANAAEIAALDKDNKDYEVKLKQLQDRELQLTREHENKVTQLKDRAAEERNHKILSADQHMRDELARGLTSSIMQHKSFADAMSAVGTQIASGMMENALKAILANDMTKPSDAAYAARQGWKAGSKFPFPVDLVMAPTLAAAAFASVMAFEGGGIVPGYGNRDTVPAMLTPGEGVIPKKLMDGLTRAAEGSGSSSEGQGRRPHAPSIVMHISTPDADSFKHSQSQLHSKAFHAATTASKRNR